MMNKFSVVIVAMVSLGYTHDKIHELYCMPIISPQSCPIMLPPYPPILYTCLGRSMREGGADWLLLEATEAFWSLWWVCPGHGGNAFLRAPWDVSTTAAVKLQNPFPLATQCIALFFIYLFENESRLFLDSMYLVYRLLHFMDEKSSGPD